MRALPVLFPMLFLVIGCGDRVDERIDSDGSSKEDRADTTLTPSAEFIRSMEHAHRADRFFSHDAIAFDLNLSFGGKSRLTGTVTMLTNSTQVMLERDDGAKALYDGETVYRYPAGADWPRARFDVLTWMYFFAAPYKLGDPGTALELLGPLPLDSDTCRAARLTFETGIGDAPDDWYIIYRSDSTHLLRVMAYIVTFDKSTEEIAKAEPHAIVYEDYREVGGILFAHRWTFTNWSREEGVSGERGVAEISNIRFVENPEFALPEGKVEVEM